MGLTEVLNHDGKHGVIAVNGEQPHLGVEGVALEMVAGEAEVAADATSAGGVLLGERLHHDGDATTVSEDGGGGVGASGGGVVHVSGDGVGEGDGVGAGHGGFLSVGLGV